MKASGVINLDKPGGISSARAVARVKRLLERGTKIGHAGTLDPFATGVLLLLVGKATKLCEGLMSERKEYEATVKLGFTTITDDPEGAEEAYAGAAEVSREAVEAAAAGMVGRLMQTPPVYSAMKVGGRRAYELARKGQEVKLEAREVRVYGVEVLGYELPLVRLRIECGRGTYIRAMARELGERLRTGGYLTELRRTRVGQFKVEGATTLEALEAGGVEKALTPLEAVRAGLGNGASGAGEREGGERA